MKEVELKFENENRSGIVAVGSYLIDAAHRLGVEIECERHGESDLCAMRITSGRDLLSAPTLAEIEQLSEQRRKDGERLSCQAKLEKTGEVVVMTNKKTAEEMPKEEEKTEDFKKEFAELPLEKKIANLLEFEFMTLGETFNFVLNSPYKIVEKAMDVMAEFGLKLEEKDKEAKRPKDHQAEANGKETETPPKKTQAKKTAQPKKSAAQEDTI